MAKTLYKPKIGWYKRLILRMFAPKCVSVEEDCIKTFRFWNREVILTSVVERKRPRIHGYIADLK